MLRTAGDRRRAGPAPRREDSPTGCGSSAATITTSLALYRAASALVYPSLYEGFGLPPLEAMAQGCPVVAARAGAMPEVLGDAAVFFDPTDVDDLAHALSQVLAADRRIEALSRPRLTAAATFTWQRTVDATLRRVPRRSHPDGSGERRRRFGDESPARRATADGAGG